MKDDRHKVLITGGAGFIGSHIAERLSQHDCQVRIIDDLSTGKMENINHFPNVFYQGDINDADVLCEAMDGCTFVFHCAACAAVQETVDYPVSTCETNMVGTVRILKLAVDLDIKRVILSSSCAVYGGMGPDKKCEEDEIRPLTPYGIQKAAGDMYAKWFWERWGQEFVSLRYFNVFGPRQNESSYYSGVISIFIKHAINGTSPTIYGSGTQSRDFIYIDDIVAANMAAAFSDRMCGNVYNVGYGIPVTINELWDTICSIVGNRTKPHYAPVREGDIYRSFASNLAIREAGFSPLRGRSHKKVFDESLRKTLDYYYTKEA